MINPVWSCKNLTVEVGGNLLLKDIQLEILPGETLGLIGKSGSGKSTLLKVILGNSIQWKGWKIKGEWTKRSKEHPVQMVFQDPFLSFNPYWTLERSLLEPIEISPNLYPSFKEYKEDLIRDFLGLFPGKDPEKYFAKLPKELSGGELQRFSILRSFQTHTKLLLLDEAMSALDLHLQQSVLDWIFEKQKEKKIALLFVSHDFSFIENFIQRVFWMDGGVLSRAGSPKEVLKAFWKKEKILR